MKDMDIYIVTKPHLGWGDGRDSRSQQKQPPDT